MSLAGLSIKRPLLMVMVILTIAMFGIVSFLRLPIDIMPKMDFPFVTVQALYIGAGPEEIENSVVKPIEEEMTGVSGLKTVTSYCMEGVAFILLEFNLGVNADLAAIDVKDKIDAILYKLPSDMKRPTIGKFDPTSEPIMQIALTGPADPARLREMADNELKESLVRVGGVGKVEIIGGREREIQVNLRKEDMDAHGLSIFQVFPVITSQTANFPAGHVTGSLREYTIRVKGEFESIDEIANLEIPAVAHGKDPVYYNVRLSAIADIKDTYKEMRETSRLNGGDAVGVYVRRRPDANTVNVADGLFKAIDEANKELPPGFKVVIAQDRSDFIRNSVTDGYTNMIQGIILTSLILLMFLFDWKLAFIAAVTMPISVVMSFPFMEMMGFSLNIVTLMALGISIGTLVANAIVVLENIVRYRDQGMAPMEAARVGTDQIFVAVLASALTNLAVFLPIASVSGITSSIFKALGLTIVFATVASLFLSFTLTPLMASRMLKPMKRDAQRKPSPMDRAMTWMESGYRRQLDWLLGRKTNEVAAVLATAGLFLFTMMVIAPRIGSEFFPASDQGYVSVLVEMPPGTPLHVTDRTLKTVEDRLRGAEKGPQHTPEFAALTTEVKLVSSKIGGGDIGSGVNVGTITVQLKPKAERVHSTREAMAIIRPQLTDLPDAKIVVQEYKTMGGGGNEADLEVTIAGIDMDRILELADSVKLIMQKTPGLVDVALSYKGVSPEVQLLPDRERLNHYGLSAMGGSMTVQGLGGLMRFNMSGNEDAVYRENGEDYPIRVQIAPADRMSIEDVENMTIGTAKGQVPLKALVAVERTAGASSITRLDRQRYVSVTANVASGTVGEIETSLRATFAGIAVPTGYKIDFGRMSEMMADSNKQLGIAGMLAIILTYMVLVALIESFLLSFVVWLTLPLGMIGIVWSLFVSGYSFSMMANMSIIMLIGVVVNNAILMIDYAQQERRDKGAHKRHAIIDAAVVKLKPILMMNLAIVLSAVPQALALGEGGEIRAPFGITAIGGILVSTVLTLYVMPVLYVWTAPRKAPKTEVVQAQTS